MASCPMEGPPLLGLSLLLLPSCAEVPAERLHHPRHATFLSQTPTSLQSCPLHQYRRCPCCHAMSDVGGPRIGSGPWYFTLRVLDPSLQIGAVRCMVNIMDSRCTIVTHQSLYSHVNVFSNICTIFSGAMEIYAKTILHPA